MAVNDCVNKNVFTNFMLISVNASQIAAWGSKMACVALKMARKSLEAYGKQVNFLARKFVSICTPPSPRLASRRKYLRLLLSWVNVAWIYRVGHPVDDYIATACIQNFKKIVRMQIT